MVDAEAPATETPVDEAVVENGAETDEVPLKPPKRLPRPSREELSAQTDSLAAEIKTRKDRVAAIRKTIELKRKGGQSPEEDALRKELNDLRAKFRALLNKKQKSKQVLDQIFEGRKKMREETREMKNKNPGIGSGSKIEDQIAELQNRHDHSSMSLNEQKKLLAEIDRLKAFRTTAAGYDERVKSLEGMDVEYNSIREELKQLDNELNANKARQDKVNEELIQVKAKAQAGSADVPTLNAEMDNCRDITKQLYAKILELRAQHDEAWNAFKKAEDEFRAWREKDRQRKNEAYQKEKDEINKARAAEDAYVAGDFYHEEVGYCDQLTAYLSKFVAADAKATVDAATAEGPATLDGGYKVFKRKDEDADSVWGLSAAKKGSKKGKKGADRKADQPSEQKLVHSIDNLNAFSKLNIELPLTTSKVPATLEVIRARKEHYLAERAKKQESGAVFTRTSAPAENGATANGHAETGTSKGAATANGNADIDLSPESVHTKMTVSEDGTVEVDFTVTGQAFPTLA
ncbi:g5674 [Coccomyxa elongata]